MTTRGEASAAINREYKILVLSWRQQYMDARPREVQELQVDEDMMHPPRALGRVIDEMIQEAVDQINALLSEKAIEVGAGPEAYDIAFNNMAHLTKMIAVRMYRFGQTMHNRLPFDSMTPCMCKTLFDDELDELLRGHPVVIEGEGWVIKNFGEGGES